MFCYEALIWICNEKYLLSGQNLQDFKYEAEE